MVKLLVVLCVLGASLFANYLLYQSNQNLGDRVLSLGNQIEQFQKQDMQLQQELESLKAQKEEIDMFRSKLEKPAPAHVSDASKSITAVAVRPILISDGFFQEARYEGTTMNITVDIREGSGLVLVNTITPTGVDFQTSAKTAVAVAQKYTGFEFSGRDIIFSISAKTDQELQAVDGPSAGMAMAVLLVLEIGNRQIPDDVLLTGTIQKDGSIGAVGGIFEKAEAAAKYGAKTFIVPDGLAITYVQECQESREGPFLYRSCKSEAKPLSPIMEERYGMRVVEATDLDSVLEYFGRD